MNNEIGKRIKDLRRKRHLTQSQIYKTCGISSGNLSSIENGKTLPSSTALIHLATCLQCTTDYILFGKTNTEIPPGDSDLPLSQEEEKLLQAFRQLSDDDKEEISLLLQLKERHRKERHRKSTEK